MRTYICKNVANRKVTNVNTVLTFFFFFFLDINTKYPKFASFFNNSNIYDMEKKFLTPHFTLEEMTASNALEQYNKRNGSNYANVPDETSLSHLKLLCHRLEDLRQKCGGHPMIVTSGYRNLLVNDLVGGAKNSMHRCGLAADLQVDLKTYSDFFYWAVQDPYSLEIYPSYTVGGHRWIHFGISPTPTSYCKIGIEMNCHLRTFTHEK